MNENELMIPPIITNMIHGMQNKNNDIWHRDNYAASLEKIHAQLSKELSAFNHEKLMTKNRKK